MRQVQCSQLFDGVLGTRFDAVTGGYPDFGTTRRSLTPRSETDGLPERCRCDVALMLALRVVYARSENPGTVNASANGRGYAFPGSATWAAATIWSGSRLPW